MKKTDVKIGRFYLAKVSGKITAVRILCESHHGGWEARNTKTGRQIHIKTAARLRNPTNNSLLKIYEPFQPIFSSRRQLVKMVVDLTNGKNASELQAITHLSYSRCEEIVEITKKLSEII